MARWTTGYTIAAVLTIVLSIGPRSINYRAEAAADPLSGRLGGTLASFEERYGAPVSGTPAQGADFTVPDFGTVFVQFKLAPDPTRPNRISHETTPESPAIVIAIGAPRSDSRSATDPDPADWSLEEAQAAVRQFLPTDVELSEPTIEGSAGSATCQSSALTPVLASATSACRIGYVLPSSTTISFATLVLAPEENDGHGPGNPCVGLAEWSRDAGSRLTAAAGLLNDLATIEESDPEAVTQLTRISTRFAALADEQHARETPPVALQIRDLLVDALTAYADAATAAATGITDQDATRIDDAVAFIASAEETVNRATTLLQRALDGCGLSVGTPVADDTGEE